MGEVQPAAGGQVDDVDPAGVALPATLELLAADGEPSSGGGVLGRLDAFLGVFALLLDGAQQRR